MISNYKYEMCFVILHYLASESTKKTVESIIECCDTDSYYIVIVDNCSPNNSGNELSEYYKNHQNIKLILNKNNSGFSAGNNVGIDYARDVLKSKFVAVCNNDIIIQDKQIYAHISNDYKKYNFAVLGPRIYQPDDKNGTHNPVNSEPYSYRETKKALINFRILSFLSYFNLDQVLLNKKNENKIVKNTTCTSNDFYEKIHMNVFLHGSFFVLSPLYLEKCKRLNEYTFMFNEELVLFKQIVELNLCTIYDPEIVIFHDHMTSSNSISKSHSRNRRIRYRRHIDSSKIIIKKYRDEWNV